jgi:hypothetical protein
MIMTAASESQASFKFAEDVKVHLVRISHRRPLWQPVLKGAEIHLGGALVDEEQTTKPHANLLPKVWQNRFRDIHSKIVKIMDTNTVAYPLDGIRQIPSTSIDDVMSQLSGLHRSEQQLVAELVANYETEIIEWNRSRLGSRFALVAPAIYPKETLSNRYAIVMQRIVISQEGTDAALLREGIENLVIGPRAQLADALEQINKLLTDGGRIRSNSFNALYNAIQLFRNFADVPGLMDAELNAKLKTLERLVSSNKATVFAESSPQAKSLAGIVSDVLETCKDEARQADMVVSFGAQRRIRID